MTRYYCDRCGNEMRERDHERLRSVSSRFQLEVITGVGGSWNGGHLCHDCIRALVALTGPLAQGGVETGRPSTFSVTDATPPR